MDSSKIKYFAPVALWALLIMIVSSIPDLGPPPINFTFADKFAHFGEYGILGFFMALAFVKTRARPILLLAILICAAYGIFDELHQLFVPGRDCDPFDAAADILGSAAGIGIYNWLKNRVAYLTYRHTPAGDAK